MVMTIYDGLHLAMIIVGGSEALRVGGMHIYRLMDLLANRAEFYCAMIVMNGCVHFRGSWWQIE